MKRPMKAVLAAVALAAGTLAAAPAMAWHHHGPRVVFGFNFGVPYYAPYYYYPAPVYYPVPVVVQSAPQVYTERSDVAAPAAPAAENSWYYCAASRGYYPYVKECPGGWQRVSPTPPSTK